MYFMIITLTPEAVNLNVCISVIWSAMARFKIWMVFGPIKLALEVILEPTPERLVL